MSQGQQKKREVPTIVADDLYDHLKAIADSFGSGGGDPAKLIAALAPHVEEGRLALLRAASFGICGASAPAPRRKQAKEAS